MHYQRWKQHGDPERVLGRESLETKFWAGIGMGPRQKHMDTPCWLWTRGTTARGYGRIWDSSQRELVYAHRESYELHYGHISSERHVDHLCHTPRCVRPDHLRAATCKQNLENRAAPQRNNTSGYQGVHWDTARQKWAAHVKHQGKLHQLGYFDDVDQAGAAAKARRLELFSHNELDRV